MKVSLVAATVTDGAGVVEINRAKERALLCLLALTPGRIVSVDRLIDGLWGDEPPRTASKTLQTYVKNLRGRIATAGAARDTLRTDPPGYLLAIDATDVDVLEFETYCRRAATVAEQGDAGSADELYAHALSLIGSADLAAFDAPGLDGARIRLEEQHRLARDDHADVLLDLGRHLDLIGPLGERLEREPGNERCCGQLMIALYRSGRQRDALQTFAATRGHLRDEFGLDPGPALVELEAQILRQELPDVGQIGSLDAHDRDSTALERAVALTIRTPDMAIDAAQALVDRVLDAAAAIERGPTRQGYRVVVANVDQAALLVNRLRRHSPQVRIAAVGDGHESEHETVARLFDSGEPINFSDDVAASLAPKRWTRGPTGWSPPLLRPSATRLPGPLEQIRDRASGYVDRGTELGVDEHVRGVLNGERRMMQVSGPAGIGKSSWLGHTAERFIDEGCAVLYGRADGKQTGGYQAMVDAGYQAVLLLDRLELEQHATHHGAALAELVPELGARVRTNLTRPSSISNAEVEAAFVDLFQRLARNQPVMLLIDDAPMLADDSVRVVERLASDPRGAALGVVLTARTEDASTPPLRRELAELCGSNKIELSRFTVDQTARFLESVAGLARSPRTSRLAQLVDQATLGLPLFVREMAHDLTRSTDWLTPDGKFRIDIDAEQITLPSSLHELLRRRLDVLDDEAKTLASVGAVFGQFSTLLVATVSELPVVDVLAALDTLVEQRVIEPIAGLADHYQFAHPLLREAARSEMGAGRTASIALAAAEYLSAQPNPSANQIDRRAELWFRAVPLAPPDRVEQELRAAAEASAARGDHRQQISHLLAQIQVAEGAGRGISAETRVALAEASVAAQVEASVRRRRARLAFEAALVAKDADFIARAALAFAGPFNPFGSLVTIDQESESIARQALEIDGISIGLRAELWGMVAAARSDVTGAAQEIGTALELAQHAGDPLVLGRLQSVAQALESSANSVVDRIARNRQIIATSESFGDRALELQGWGWMVADAFEAGDIALMESAAAKRSALAERLGDTTYRWSDLVYQGMRLTIAGRFEQAEAVLWQALEVGRLPLGDHANRFFGLQLLKLSEMRGDGESMLGPAQEYAEQLGYVTAYVSVAHLHAVLGTTDQAQQIVADKVPADLSELPFTYDRLPTLALLARIAQRTGDSELATRVQGELTPATGRLCVHADAVLYGSVDHNLARCAITTGRGRDALELLDSCRSIYDNLGAEAWVHLLELDTCEALDLLGEHEQAAERRADLAAS